MAPGIESVDLIRAAAAPLLGVLPLAAWLPHAIVRKPDGKLDKPPRCGATTNSPASWFTLDAALEQMIGPNDVAGIGFALTAGIIGLDYDDCRNPETGALDPEVQRELERIGSFAYVTPSGKGIRIVGTNPDAAVMGGKRVRYLPDEHRIEIFIGPTNHFNTFTAQVIPGYENLRDISDEVMDYLIGLPGGSRDTAQTTVPPTGATPERCLQAIQAALAIIPNASRDWDAWTRIGMATWRASGGAPEGLELWRTWSAKHFVHDDAECNAAWARFHRSPPTRIGFGTLYYEARRVRPMFVAPNDPFDGGSGEFQGSSGDHDKPQHDPATGEIIPFPATPLSSLDLDNIPPREWLYGRELLRGFVSVMGSPGGVGKTAYTLSAGFSVACNRSLLAPPLTVPGPFLRVHKAGPVWFYNLEDPSDEMRRRIKALLMHHHLSVHDLAHPVYVDSGRDRPLVITHRDERGTLIARPVVEDLVAELKRRGIVLLVVDPFVQSHTAEENRNEEMNLVMALWGQVAHRAQCALWLVHHFRKGGQGGDSEAFRGAGAIQGAARVMSTLSAMSIEEAGKLGIEPEQRRQFIRLDNAKANMSPSADRAEWYKLVSVSINNSSTEYPDGDSVQVIEPWEPPSPWDGLGWATINRVLQMIQDGPSPGEKYAFGKQAKDRWAGRVLVSEAGKTDGQAAAIIKTWIENGLLEQGQYSSPSQRGALTGCVSVNTTKLAEMKAGAAGTSSNDV